jgi:pentatricopeptide repeat protein
LPTIWIQLINCLSKSNNYREFVLMFDFILSP